MVLGTREVRSLGAEPFFEETCALGVPSGACPLDLVDSSSFSSVTVVAVHVDVETSAFRTDSALTCSEVMLMISRYNAS